ncbi:hypothetical protein [[Clostridium] colinum]
MTNGLNTFIENVVLPIKETQYILYEFAKGNFSIRNKRKCKYW